MDCTGNGVCLIQISSNSYGQNSKCQYNCVPKNCLGCNVKIPEWVFTIHGDHCVNCAASNYGNAMMSKLHDLIINQSYTFTRAQKYMKEYKNYPTTRWEYRKWRRENNL